MIAKLRVAVLLVVVVCAVCLMIVPVASATITVDQFVANTTGTTVGDGQCVALVDQYLLQVCGITTGAWGNAVDYQAGGTAGNHLAADGFTWSTNQNFANGDILVWGAGAYTSSLGHVAVWYNGENFEQNPGPAGLHPFFSSGYLGHWRKGLADGTFVQVSGSPAVYRIVGGAPLYVSNWNAFGGAQPVTVISQAQFNALAAYPANGTFISSTSDGRCYEVAGGAPEYISAADASKVPGWGSRPVIGIDQWDLDNTSNPAAHLRQYPADGTFVSNVDDGRCYVAAGGAPEYISAADASKVPGWGSRAITGLSGYEFANYQHLRPYPADGTVICNVDDGRVYVVAGGAPEYVSASDAAQVPAYVSNPHTGLSGYEFASYQHLRPYPADGTLVSNVDDGRCYVVAGGAPEWISAADASKVPGWGTQPLTELSGYEFSNYQHLRPYPVDGTFLVTTSGKAYRVAGHAPVAITSWSVFGGAQPYVTIDQWDIDAAGDPGIGLGSTPVDGTVVEGLPSRAYWYFKAGLRHPASASAAAVQEDDAGLAAFPVYTAPDTIGPTTYARATTGTRSHAIVLRYKIVDNQSPTAVDIRIVVKNGHGATLRTFRPTSKATATWYSVKWTPKARGTFRYSVYAKDLSGNPQSKVGSAKVVVK